MQRSILLCYHYSSIQSIRSICLVSSTICIWCFEFNTRRNFHMHKVLLRISYTYASCSTQTQAFYELDRWNFPHISILVHENLVLPSLPCNDHSSSYSIFIVHFSRSQDERKQVLATSGLIIAVSIPLKEAIFWCFKFPLMTCGMDEILRIIEEYFFFTPCSIIYIEIIVSML